MSAVADGSLFNVRIGSVAVDAADAGGPFAHAQRCAAASARARQAWPNRLQFPALAKCRCRQTVDLQLNFRQHDCFIAGGYPPLMGLPA